MTSNTSLAKQLLVSKIVLWFAVALCALPAAAQTTAVTGTVKDTNGVPYAGATLKAQLVLAGGGATGQATVTVTGVQACRSSGFGSSPCQVPFQGTNGPITLDLTGSFSLVLQDNSLVTPASTQWLFTVTSNGSPPPLGTGPQTCTATITITGASQSVSGNFSCPALGTSVVSTSPVLINQSVDNFNRASLGANWTNWINSVTTTAGPPSFASGATASQYNLAAFTGVSNSNGAQHLRSTFFTVGANGSAGVALRINGTPTSNVNFYECIESNTAFAIVRVTGASNAAAGTVTVLATTAVTGVAGDWIDCAVMGNDISAIRNGTTGAGGGFLQVHDTAITTGLPGIIFTLNATGAPQTGYFTSYNSSLPGSASVNIVVDGDSIAASNGQGSPSTDPFTSFLQYTSPTAYVMNLAVGGKCLGVGCAATSSGTLDSMVTTGTSVIDPLCVSGVKNILILVIAENGIAVGGQTPAQVITSLTTYVANRHAASCQWKVLVAGGFSRLTTSSPSTDQQESTLNTLISVNAAGADAVIPLPGSLTAMGSSSGTSLFNVDQIHPVEIAHIDILARAATLTLAKF